MKKAPYIKIITTISAAVVLVILLFYNSNRQRKLNAFNRYFPPHFLTDLKILDLQYNSYYIAGLTNDRIYLGNITSPLNIINSNYELNDTTHQQISVPFDDKDSFVNPKLFVDNENIYMIFGKPKMILSSRLPLVNLSKRYDIGDYNIENAIPINPNTIVFKSFDRVLHRNILRKINLLSNETISASGILQNQMDGRFSTDGMLSISPDKNSIFYIYFYRNQIMVMDSNLNLAYRNKTIDTISVAQIKLDTNFSEKMVTTSEPPLIVNSKSSISDKYVFISSTLIANNEQPEIFNRSSVIDIYNSKTGLYIYSFYFPNFKKNRLKDFKVHDNKIVAVVDHYLITYQMNFQ
jgi:hypothetical protein